MPRGSHCWELFFATRELTDAERAAHDDVARPGWWCKEDLRTSHSHRPEVHRITQDQTDFLIRAELLTIADPDTAGELLRYFSKPPDVSIESEDSHRSASQQHGGIDSDPMVRLFAYRAWGDRDRKRFDPRAPEDALSRRGSVDRAVFCRICGDKIMPRDRVVSRNVYAPIPTAWHERCTWMRPR